MIIKALEQIPLFVSAALPTRIFPPLFNRYEPGMTFGAHVDNAIRQIPGTPFRVRTDLSATLFISRPEEYDGGELVVDDTYGTHAVKLPAGDMILYPATSLHRVNPVTRGRAAGLLLLDREHGARRRRAHPALRPRHGHRQGQPGRARSPGRGGPDLLLPQPPAPLGECLARRRARDEPRVAMTFPRMTFHRAIFWLHLLTGTIAGLVILVMSVTGVLLAFEPQIVDYAERGFRQVTPPASDASKLAHGHHPGQGRKRRGPTPAPSPWSSWSEPQGTVRVAFGRDDGVFVNPYTGELLGPGSKVHDAMHVIEDWHRWLGSRDVGRPLPVRAISPSSDSPSPASTSGGPASGTATSSAAASSSTEA